MSRAIPVQARYVRENQHLIIKTKRREVRGMVTSVSHEKGFNGHNGGRIHVTLAGHAQPFALNPDQTVHVL